MNWARLESTRRSSTFARIFAFLGLCLGGFLLTVPLLGQTGQGTVTGTVTDLSQAIVPNANVTLTHVETGVTTKGQSSDVGIYYFGAVPIGPYKITVEKGGFETWVGTFTLAVGQNAVVNVALKVGSTTTIVEVTGAAAPIETQNGAVSDVKESAQIRDLPLNGRQVGELFGLTPGVESGSGGARVNGMKVGSLDINMDGVTMVDRFGGGMVRVQPGIETVQEFRIDTVGSEARFDQPSTVVMASRSGTNQLHGAGYEYLRDNSVIGATRLRTDPVGSAFQLPLLIRNEFGGYISGPVYIPHIWNGKDKAFWFFDYEGLRSRARSSPLFPTVPTAADWQGDLSNLVNVNIPCSGTGCPLGYSPITVYDPTTTNPVTFQRTPFPNNQIPGPLEQTAAVLKSLTAAPTNSTNPFVGPNFTSTYPSTQSVNNYTVKWDQNITDKDRLSVRYTRSLSNSAIEGGYFANPADPASGMGSSADNFVNINVGVNYNRTISPTWLNELLVGVLRDPNHYGTLADFTDWPSKLGLPNPFGVTGWPTMYTSEASGSYFGWDSDNNHLQHLTSETVEDNVTWTRGKHTFQFGFRGRYEQNYVAELQQAQGSHNWGPAYTAQFDVKDLTSYPDTGSGFAELLLGLPNYLSNQYNRGYFYFRQTEEGLYFQDKIKMSPRLTLNLGLRWDHWTPYTEARDRLTVPYNPQNFQFGVPNQPWGVLTPGNVNINSLGTPASVIQSWSNAGLAYATANSVGYPSNLFRSIYHDFAPRVGIAYQINHNTVVRGSYGIYYVAMPLALILQSTRTNPPLNLRFQNNPYNNPAVPGGPTGPYFGLYPLAVVPAPTDYLPTATVDINNPSNNVQPYGNGATTWDGPNWNDERQQTWNLTVEHELPYHTGLRLSYIGTYGGNLEQQYAVNDEEPKYNYAVRTGMLPPSPANLLAPVPQWSLYGLNHTGYSRDHSFQVELHRTFANGVAFQMFYTFVRAMTTTDPSGFSDGNTSVGGGNGNGTLGGGGGATVPEFYELLGEPNVSYKQRLRLTYSNYVSIPPSHIGFNGIYDLPFGRGKHFGHDVSKPLDYLVGGWQVATIGIWNSGLWMGVNPALVQPGPIRIPSSQRATFNISGSNDNYRQWYAGNFNVANAYNIKGTPVPAVAREAGPNCSGDYLGQLAVTLADGSCYNAPFSGFYNPAPRNNFIGPGAWNVDLSLYKHFKIGERFDMRFAADFFNAFNHPNDPPPNTSTGLQDISLQSVTSTGGLNDPRQIQLSLRVEF